MELFKLLYFPDFEHYQETGRSVTGLEYHAWRKGPVPVTLFEEFEVLPPDLKDSLQTNSTKRFMLRAGVVMRTLLPALPMVQWVQNYTLNSDLVCNTFVSVSKLRGAADLTGFENLSGLEGTSLLTH